MVCIKNPETIIGRRKGCDIRIPSSRVSRRHCRLSIRNEYLHVEDLGSLNGTYLNGEEIHSTAMVLPGDILQVGPISFMVQYDPKVEPAVPVAPSAQRESMKDRKPQQLPAADSQDSSVGSSSDVQLFAEDGSDSLVHETESESDSYPMLEYADDDESPRRGQSRREPSKHAHAANSSEMGPAVFDFEDDWQAPSATDFRKLLADIEEDGGRE